MARSGRGNRRNWDYQAEIAAWRNAKDRCSRESHPQYADYGGRGITMSEEYADPKDGFVRFLLEVGPKPSPQHTLDRINNDKGYQKGNIRWEPSRRAQAANQRPKRAVGDLGWGFGEVIVKGDRRTAALIRSPLIEHDGRKQTVVEWARETGLATRTIFQRVRRGWSVERVLDPVLLNPRGKPRAGQSQLGDPK